MITLVLTLLNFSESYVLERHKLNFEFYETSYDTVLNKNKFAAFVSKWSITFEKTKYFLYSTKFLHVFIFYRILIFTIANILH